MTKTRKRLLVIILTALALAALTLLALTGERDNALHSGARFIMKGTANGRDI